VVTTSLKPTIKYTEILRESGKRHSSFGPATIEVTMGKNRKKKGTKQPLAKIPPPPPSDEEEEEEDEVEEEIDEDPEKRR
jgi:hypothetical protein